MPPLRTVPALLLSALLAVGCSDSGSPSPPAEESPFAADGEQASSAAPATGSQNRSPAEAHALDLAGREVDPLALAREDPSVEAVVLIFTDPDCPISNRYAPEVRSIGEDYGGAVAFWLVYPDPTVTPQEVEEHVEAYGYAFPALRDPEYRLVDATGASIYSEVAVLDPDDGRLLYRGRVNDRFVDFGVTRPRATTHDLREALEAVVSGRPVPTPTTRAIGCYIPPHDLVASGDGDPGDAPS